MPVAVGTSELRAEQVAVRVEKQKREVEGTSISSVAIQVVEPTVMVSDASGLSASVTKKNNPGEKPISARSMKSSVSHSATSVAGVPTT